MGDPTAKLEEFSLAATPPAASKKKAVADKSLPVEVQVRNWLERQYPDSWTRNIWDSDPGSPVIVLGFDTRPFLQMVGIECARYGKPAPVGMWLTGINCREAMSLVGAPADVSFVAACQLLNIRLPNDGNWTTPHVDPLADMTLLLQLVARLRLLDRPLNILPAESQPAATEELVNA